MRKTTRAQTSRQNAIIQRASVSSRLMRLSTMVHIRWLAIFCQLATVLVVGFGLQFSLPLIPCLLVIACSAGLNIFLILFYGKNHQLSFTGATCLLIGDIWLLSGLLYLTGGLVNPFALLLLAPACLGIISLHIRNIVVLDLWTIAVITFLLLFHEPLPWRGERVDFPLLLIEGMWAALVAALIFITFCGYYVAEEARRLADALTATELALQHEQHLSALDGLAAAAAHELGTPLATIQLVAREMRHELAQMPRFAEDMDLLVSQTQRCRDILQRLTHLSTENGGYIDELPFTALVEEVVAAHRYSGMEILVERGETQGDEPVFQRNPGMLYGIGNLVENAVDFAHSQVLVHYQWAPGHIVLAITDDGDGFSPQVLDRIGQPYMHGRETGRQGGGLGLGVFIAKTLLERSGATLSFRNSKEKNRGAEIGIVWPNGG
ncbi:MAG: Two component sensory histidine kinase [Candidatus Tokpelaia hoelldobleri]|uniref:histidine kinase n=1 Tax=Candidatus Tokpelaia hoelldobleri TaxID=1902579 RepID=A0A1U9JV07_9HYPH|nr:MAG: Two component sensory histidine kinase [Candidatus Tokpelaia hoelldoblerii]